MLPHHKLFSSLSVQCFARFLPFVQFKKREKHPWRSVTFSKVAGCEHATLLKVTPPLMFSRFLNCTNYNKSRNASHM